MDALTLVEESANCGGGGSYVFSILDQWHDRQQILTKALIQVGGRLAVMQRRASDQDPIEQIRKAMLRAEVH